MHILLSFIFTVYACVVYLCICTARACLLLVASSVCSFGLQVGIPFLAFVPPAFSS